VREEWVPDAHAHRISARGRAAAGDAITSRELLMWNGDVEISLARPTETMDYFFRNGEGDEYLRARGSARSKRFSATCRTSRATTSSCARNDLPLRARREQRYLVFETPGLITIPKRYRNEHGS